MVPTPASHRRAGQFFELLAQTAFANPFSDERADLERKIRAIAGCFLRFAHVDELDWRQHRAGPKTETEAKPTAEITGQRISRCMQTVFLFASIHQHYKDCDQLDLDQVLASALNRPSQIRFRSSLAKMRHQA